MLLPLEENSFISIRISKGKAELVSREPQLVVKPLFPALLFQHFVFSVFELVRKEGNQDIPMPWGQSELQPTNPRNRPPSHL